MFADGNHCQYGEIVCDGVSQGFTTDAFCYWSERAQRNQWGVQQRFPAGCGKKKSPPGRRLAAGKGNRCGSCNNCMGYKGKCNGRTRDQCTHPGATWCGPLACSRNEDCRRNEMCSANVCVRR